MEKSDFEILVAEHQEPLRRFLMNLSGGNSALADDIAQDAFIKAYIGFSSFKGHSKISTWLFRIAYNCFFDEIRKAKKYDQLSNTMQYESENTKEIFPDHDLYSAIKNLNDKEKAVILLFYMEDKSIKEISKITNTGINSVKSQLSRGKSHLKEYLTKIGYER